MINNSKYEGYKEKPDAIRPASKLLRVGLISAASVIAGSLATAWWYRKTLSKLQNPIETAHDQPQEFPETEEEVTPSSETESRKRPTLKKTPDRKVS
jgi:hypothetical protein